MKNRTLAVALIAAAAWTPMAFAAPAAVIKEGSCTIILPDQTPVVATRVRLVVTKSKAGVVTLKCQARIDGYDQGPYNDKGFNCDIPIPGAAEVTTTNSRLTISANGNATQTCKIKTNGTPP